MNDALSIASADGSYTGLQQRNADMPAHGGALTTRHYNRCNFAAAKITRQRIPVMPVTLPRSPATPVDHYADYASPAG